MRFLYILILLSLSLIHSDDYQDAHYLILDNEDSTIDGMELGKDGFYYTPARKEVTIKKPGTYIVTGRLDGQLEVNCEENDTVTLVLDGVRINATNASGILFKGAYEFDKLNGTNGTGIVSLEDAKSLNYSGAGAHIIIADDSVNTIYGGHSNKHDGGISSKVSMIISAESKGNGVLNIYADIEGLEIKKHLLIEGGIINIRSYDDGVNLKVEGSSVLTIAGGTITSYAGLGSRGDGIDSNGYVLIKGGTVYTQSKMNGDAGLEGSIGIVIDGGTVIALGTPMHLALSSGNQPTMNLRFASEIPATAEIKIKDSYGNEILRFCPTSMGFFNIDPIRNYTGAVISCPDFDIGVDYYLYMDDVLLGNGGKYEENFKGYTIPPKRKKKKDKDSNDKNKQGNGNRYGGQGGNDWQIPTGSNRTNRGQDWTFPGGNGNTQGGGQGWTFPGGNGNTQGGGQGWTFPGGNGNTQGGGQGWTFPDGNQFGGDWNFPVGNGTNRYGGYNWPRGNGSHHHDWSMGNFTWGGMNSYYSKCDRQNSMNTTRFQLSSNATTFNCVQGVPYSM